MRIKPYWIAAFILSAVFAVFGPYLGNEFVDWDDMHLVVNNPLVTSWNPAIWWSFDPELYVPLTLLTYQIEHAFFGANSFVFHFTNAFLHAMNAILVSGILFRLLQRRDLAYIGGFIFALHPLHTEAVLWASARKDVLFAFFFLVSVYGYIQEWKMPYIFMSFVAAMLSKVTAVVLFPVLFIIDWLQGNVRIQDKIGYGVVVIIFSIVAILGKTSNVQALSLGEFFLLGTKSIVLYLQKIFWPADLSPLYLYTKDITLASPDFFVPLLVFILLCGTIGFLWQRRSSYCFGLVWFLVTMLPSFFAVSKAGEIYLASDRYAYIPSIGILYCVLYALRNVQMRWVVWVLSVAVLCVFANSTRMQATVWQDTPSMYQHVLEIDPESHVALNNLAVAMLRNGQYEDAKWHLERAVSLKDNYSDALMNLSVAQFHLDEVAGAEQTALQVTDIRPDMLKAWFNLGWMYEQQGKLDEALEAFARALEIREDEAQVHWHIGHVYGKQGKYKEGLKAYQRAMEIDGMQEM